MPKKQTSRLLASHALNWGGFRKILSRQIFKATFFLMVLILPSVNASPRDDLVETFDRLRYDLISEYADIAASSGMHAEKNQSLPSMIENIYNTLCADFKSDEWTFETRLHEARQCFDIATFAARADGLETVLSDAASMLDRFHRRGVATDAMIRRLHAAFLSTRNFEAAEAMRAEYDDAGLQAPPPIENGRARRRGERPLLKRNAEGDALSLEPFDFRSFSGLVFVTHPACGFSANVETAVRNDAELRLRFLNDTLWLMDASTDLNLKILNAHDEIDLHVAYRNNDWPEIVDWATPGFYFIREGHVLSSFIGWPKGEEDERLDRLREGFAAVKDLR